MYWDVYSQGCEDRTHLDHFLSSAQRGLDQSIRTQKVKKEDRNKVLPVYILIVTPAFTASAW